MENNKQETLEEAAEKWLNKDDFNIYNHYDTRPSFIEGAKWQQEQILDFLYEEITERRDYSASKMCEVVIDYIKQNK
jgi:hypothetical protein